MHACRTDSDASHHSFSFTARARPPDSDAQRGSTLSPRGSQGGIPLSPRASQPSSAREIHNSAKPRPDSSFAVKVSGFYLCNSNPFSATQNMFFLLPTCAKDMHARADSHTKQPGCYKQDLHRKRLRMCVPDCRGRHLLHQIKCMKGQFALNCLGCSAFTSFPLLQAISRMLQE